MLSASSHVPLTMQRSRVRARGVAGRAPPGGTDARARVVKLGKVVLGGVCLGGEREVA